MTTDERHSKFVLSVLAACVGAIAACGIVYQLVVGTISTYLLGNSTFQFSLTIGLFMSAYGVGSFLSTRVQTRLADWFAATEIALGLFGGVASFVLFYLYATSELFGLGRFVLIAAIGTLVGLEIPLLIRISEEHRENLRITVGQMIGLDYIGALVGGIAFPLVLLPAWGLLGASFLVGICNIVVAVVSIVTFRRELARPKLLLGACAAVAVLLGAAAMQQRDVERWIESSLYEDPLVHMEQSQYQRLVMTKFRDDLRLYLDGSLQFSAADEYRYHESLVHPAATRLPAVKRVLILGGGDGLALRELRNYPEIDHITLVDLDPAVVELGRTHPELTRVNVNAFEALDPEVVNADAFTWLRDSERMFDLILVDLPDPHHESLAKLYSVSFYVALRDRLTPNGLVAAQLGSPFFARHTYWTAVATMERAGLNPLPYHVQVPSFGEWGFAIGGATVREQPVRDFSGRFYDTEMDATMFRFAADMRPPAGLAPNTLIRPVIVEHFRRDWRRWN